MSVTIVLISYFSTTIDREACMDEKSKKLKKMVTWIVAVFATIFAIVMAVLWIPLYGVSGSAFGAIGQAFAAGWMMILLDLVLCVGTYLGYSYYVNRKK